VESRGGFSKFRRLSSEYKDPGSRTSVLGDCLKNRKNGKEIGRRKKIARKGRKEEGEKEG
jgi:hypothetical protein